MFPQSFQKLLSFRSDRNQNKNSPSNPNSIYAVKQNDQKQQHVSVVTQPQPLVNLYFTYVDIDISGSVFNRLAESHRAMSSLTPSQTKSSIGSTLYRPKTVSGLNNDDIFKEFETKMKLKYSDKNLQTASKSSLVYGSGYNFKMPQDPGTSKRSSQVSLNCHAVEAEDRLGKHRNGSWRRSIRTLFSSRSKSSQQICASTSCNNFEESSFDLPFTERAASLSRVSQALPQYNKRKRFNFNRKSSSTRPASIASDVTVESCKGVLEETSLEFSRGPTIRRSFKSLSSPYINESQKLKAVEVPLPNLDGLDIHEKSLIDEGFEHMDDELNETLKCCDETFEATHDTHESSPRHVTSPNLNNTSVFSQCSPPPKSTIPQYLQAQGVLDPQCQPSYFVANNGYLDKQALRLISLEKCSNAAANHGSVKETSSRFLNGSSGYIPRSTLRRFKSFKPDDGEYRASLTLTHPPISSSTLPRRISHASAIGATNMQLTSTNGCCNRKLIPQPSTEQPNIGKFEHANYHHHLESAANKNTPTTASFANPTYVKVNSSASALHTQEFLNPRRATHSCSSRNNVEPLAANVANCLQLHSHQILRESRSPNCVKRQPSNGDVENGKRICLEDTSKQFANQIYGVMSDNVVDMHNSTASTKQPATTRSTYHQLTTNLQTPTSRASFFSRICKTPRTAHVHSPPFKTQPILQKEAQNNKLRDSIDAGNSSAPPPRSVQVSPRNNAFQKSRYNDNDKRI